MRKIRLTADGMSSCKIAAGLSIGATTVIDCQHRARMAGVADNMTDEMLEARLFPASTALAQAKARRPTPDWALIHRELKRRA